MFSIVIHSLNVTSLGVPSAPLNVVYHVSYGIAEYSVRVQWQTPSDDGGVGISNYTLTLASDALTIMKTTINTAENIHDLNYNTSYSIAVAARNCVGSSTFTSLDMMQGEDVLLYCVTESITIISSNLPSPSPLQLAAVVHLLQSMAVLRSTGVQRRGHRSSSTVTRATLPVSGTHHNASSQHGPQTLNYSTVHLTCLVHKEIRMSIMNSDMMIV